jgi:anaerobic magnesium-protoporphyrin IX monomethyl ester cyclase
MRILLVAANDRPQAQPTLGLVYLAAYARQAFPDLVFRYMDHLPSDPAVVAEFAPDLVAISALTHQFERTRQWTRAFRQASRVPVVLGGYHISACPHQLPAGCDVGVLGEGEGAFSDLIALLRDSGGFDPLALAAIPGLVFRGADGELQQSRKRPHVVPLDLIPPPARDLLDMDRYLEDTNVVGTRIGRGASMFTARGCPYACIFCASQAFWGVARFHSPEYVVDEIRLLVERYGTRIVHIYDDLFAIKTPRLRRIVELIESAGLHQRAEFGVFCRANAFDEELGQLLRRMNVSTLEFGFESGAPRVLDLLKAGSMSVEHSRRAVDIARAQGFSVCGSVVIGSPDETEEEMLETLRLVDSLDLDKFTHFILCPFPGTPLWEWARDRGLVADEMDFAALDMKKAGGFTAEELEARVVLTDKVDRGRLAEIYGLFEERRTRRWAYRWDAKAPATDDVPL